MASLRYKVVGPLEINGVEPGKVVELDPEQVNIGALVAAGHVEPESKAASKAAGGEE